MASRRQVREAVIQFLYCADLEGGADPADLREPFWDFVTESDRRSLQLATFRMVHHLAHGREGRLDEFNKRQKAAETLLAAWPEAEPLQLVLSRISRLESQWSESLVKMEKFSKVGEDASVADNFSSGLDRLFKIDHDLELARNEFITGMDKHPKLKGRLEAVAATIRRLQRISDRLRMVEQPENFPEQADLARLRESKERMAELRKDSDMLTDKIIANKEPIDASLASIVENFSPERIDPVDRAILRLAAYEISQGDVPVKVAINEAIELAKKFGTSDSKRFVNGVLDKLSKPSPENSETA